MTIIKKKELISQTHIKDDLIFVIMQEWYNYEHQTPAAVCDTVNSEHHGQEADMLDSSHTLQKALKLPQTTISAGNLSNHEE